MTRKEFRRELTSLCDERRFCCDERRRREAAEMRDPEENSAGKKPSVERRAFSGACRAPIAYLLSAISYLQGRIVRSCFPALVSCTRLARGDCPAGSADGRIGQDSLACSVYPDFPDQDWAGLVDSLHSPTFAGRALRSLSRCRLLGRRSGNEVRLPRTIGRAAAVEAKC